MKTKFVQFSIFLFLLYLFWYAEAFDSVAIFLYGGTALVAISTACYINKRKWSGLRLPAGIQWWILWGVYCGITGIVVATDKAILFSGLLTYFAFLFVLSCIAIVVKGIGDIRWLLKQIVAVSVLCALYTMVRGFDYYNGVIVRTMGSKNNPNTLGALMVFGTFSLLYLSKPRLKTMAKDAIPLVLFMYVIILTGSKKALLAEGLLIGIWTFGYCKGMKKTERLSYRLLAYSLIVVCATIIVYYFATEYVNTASFARMQTLKTSGSTGQREGMYSEAIEMFRTSPLFGVGYSQFRVLSRYGTYSHATYAELIADTGILGTLLFIYPILLTGKKLVHQKRLEDRYRQSILLGLYAVELFMGAVNIFFYEFSHLLMWVVLFIAAEELQNMDRNTVR